ncbi:MAG: nucleotidyltransferase family protein, partial [Clostridia bacterium]|nr:nucleotidyltransferase family protein [Clostridia bacterium]
SEGISFASARSLAVSSKFGEGAQEILKNPNDILGIEYCKAIKKLNSGIIPAAIRRIGAGHDCDKAENGIASASYIRENENFTDYIPSSIKPLYREEQNAGRFPAKTDKIDRIILYKLQSMTLEDIAALPDISEGLENKIYAAAQVSRSVSQLIENVKSKRYSHARIRRILLCAALGIDKTLTFTPIPYIRVLGFNKKGRELLSEINKKSKLPVLSTTAQLKEYGGKFFEAECRTTALFGLALPKVLPANYELITPIVTL